MMKTAGGRVAVVANEKKDLEQVPPAMHLA